MVRTLNEALSFRQGEVLVHVATDPDWTPRFRLAAALVTESRRTSCRAAVVAREYHLPGVVGTRTATQVIQDDQIIEVDGVEGRYRLRSPRPQSPAGPSSVTPGGLAAAPVNHL